MNIRLFNAKILTMEDPIVVSTGSIWIQNEKIVYIGDESDIDQFYQKKGADCNPLYSFLWDREIDCNGNLIMPGFQNAHTHSPMTGLRSFADDMPLDQWLNTKIFPAEQKLTEEDMYWFTKLAILEYLDSGVAGIFDMYFANDAVVSACKEFGMPVTLCGAVNDFVQSVSVMEHLYQKYNTSDTMVKYCLGFHAQYTTGERLLREISELSHELKAPVFTHISETKKEVEQCIAEHGSSPFVYLNKLGIFDYGGGGFHCVHTDDQDVSIMKEKKIAVVTNPSSNMKLASGVAPIQKYLDNDITVAIGTDGPASNNCLSMWKEMFLVSGLTKLKDGAATSGKAEDIIKMATKNGALVRGVEKTGRLKEDQYADLIMIDLHKPCMQPIHNIVSNLVYSAGRDNVIMTMIRGKILYEYGHYNLSEQPELIYDKCNQIVEKFTK